MGKYGLLMNVVVLSRSDLESEVDITSNKLQAVIRFTDYRLLGTRSNMII